MITAVPEYLPKITVIFRCIWAAKVISVTDIRLLSPTKYTFDLHGNMMNYFMSVDEIKLILFSKRIVATTFLNAILTN